MKSMTQQQNPEERAIDAVRKRNSDHSDFSVGAVIPRYLNGTLYVILFNNSKGQGFENYVYIPDDDASIEVWRNTSQMAHAVSLHTRSSSVFERLADLGGMTGLIAAAITATICYLTIQSAGETKIPDVLSNALTMVLGFYFGSKVNQSRD